MAKNRNTASTRANKLRNNARTSNLIYPLRCSTAGCQTEALIVRPANKLGIHKRECAAHYIKTATASERNRALLRALGMVA